eukprot:2647704-Pleurochrysis_carterae.AAC.1
MSSRPTRAWRGRSGAGRDTAYSCCESASALTGRCSAGRRAQRRAGRPERGGKSRDQRGPGFG